MFSWLENNKMCSTWMLTSIIYNNFTSINICEFSILNLTWSMVVWVINTWLCWDTTTDVNLQTWTLQRHNQPHLLEFTKWKRHLDSHFLSIIFLLGAYLNSFFVDQQIVFNINVTKRMAATARYNFQILYLYDFDFMTN